jgi:hypothetical protein
MQSNIIDFPKSKQPDATGVLQEVARSLVASFSAASAAALSSSIDDLAKAVDKVAILVEAMPQGEARVEAAVNLETIRSQLSAARTLNERVR